MLKMTWFHTDGELLELTKLPSRESLWKAGFDLDDWDFGFVTNKEIDNEALGYGWGSETPYYEHWLLQHAENYCVGYRHVEYKKKHYYMIYHS